MAFHSCRLPRLLLAPWFGSVLRVGWTWFPGLVPILKDGSIVASQIRFQLFVSRHFFLQQACQAHSQLFDGIEETFESGSVIPDLRGIDSHGKTLGKPMRMLHALRIKVRHYFIGVALLRLQL